MFKLLFITQYLQAYQWNRCAEIGILVMLPYIVFSFWINTLLGMRSYYTALF